MCPFCSFKFHQMQNCRCTQYTYFTGNSFTLNNIVRISSGLHFLHILLNITELNHLWIDSWLGHMTDLLFSFDFKFSEKEIRIKDDIQLTRTWSWSAVLLLLLLGRPAAENIYQLFQILKCDTLGMREGERESIIMLYIVPLCWENSSCPPLCVCCMLVGGAQCSAAGAVGGWFLAIVSISGSRCTLCAAGQQ